MGPLASQPSRSHVVPSPYLDDIMYVPSILPYTSLSTLTRAPLVAAGLFDVNDSCPASVFAELRQSNLDSDPPGTLFEQDLWGLGASVLSLATNFVATALIGITAWYVSRRVGPVARTMRSRGTGRAGNTGTSLQRCS